MTSFFIYPFFEEGLLFCSAFLITKCGQNWLVMYTVALVCLNACFVGVRGSSSVTTCNKGVVLVAFAYIRWLRVLKAVLRVILRWCCSQAFGILIFILEGGGSTKLKRCQKSFFLQRRHWK